MSSARCTNDSAIQSMPSVRPKSRSARSFSRQRRQRQHDAGHVDALAVGQQAAVDDDRVGEVRLPHCSTRRRSRPSSSSSSVAAARAPRRSRGAAARRGSRRPASRVEVEAERRAFDELHRALGERADAQLRPLQVEQDADRAADSVSIERIRSSRCLWSACVPWLKLRRNTSAPASNSACDGRAVGARRGRAWRRSWRCRGVSCVDSSDGRPSITMARKSLTLVQRRAGDDRVAERLEEAVAVVVVEASRADRCRARQRARQRVGRDDGAGDCPRRRRCRRCRRRSRGCPAAPLSAIASDEQELDVAAAAAAAAHGHRGFAAGQQDAGRRERLAVPRDLARDAGHAPCRRRALRLRSRRRGCAASTPASRATRRRRFERHAAASRSCASRCRRGAASPGLSVSPRRFRAARARRRASRCA